MPSVSHLDDADPLKLGPVVVQDVDVHSVSAENGDLAVDATHWAATLQHFDRVQFVAVIRLVNLLDDEVAVSHRIEVVVRQVHVPNFFTGLVLVLEFVVLPHQNLFDVDSN